MNLRNMSMQKLKELEDKIKAEKERRGGVTYKSDILVSYWFKEEFDEDMKKKGCTNEDWYFDWDKPVFRLCDLTFGNYQIKNKKNTRGASPFMNGAVIDYSGIDIKKYRAMVNDILEVIKKYHKEEEQ